MAVVLVVDDDDDIRDIVAHCVNRAGHTVIAAEHGTAALALAIDGAIDGAIDLAVLDWSMPGMNGGELCAGLHALPHLEQLPVLILTAHGDRETRLAAEQAGATSYLTKPFSIHELVARVNAMLGVEDEVA